MRRCRMVVQMDLRTLVSFVTLSFVLAGSNKTLVENSEFLNLSQSSNKTLESTIVPNVDLLIGDSNDSTEFKSIAPVIKYVPEDFYPSPFEDVSSDCGNSILPNCTTIEEGLTSLETSSDEVLPTRNTPTAKILTSSNISNGKVLSSSYITTGPLLTFNSTSSDKVIPFSNTSSGIPSSKTSSEAYYYDTTSYPNNQTLPPYFLSYELYDYKDNLNGSLDAVFFELFNKSSSNNSSNYYDYDYMSNNVLGTKPRVNRAHPGKKTWQYSAKNLKIPLGKSYSDNSYDKSSAKSFLGKSSKDKSLDKYFGKSPSTKEDEDTQLKSRLGKQAPKKSGRRKKKKKRKRKKNRRRSRKKGKRRKNKKNNKNQQSPNNRPSLKPLKRLTLAERRRLAWNRRFHNRRLSSSSGSSSGSPSRSLAASSGSVSVSPSGSPYDSPPRSSSGSTYFHGQPPSLSGFIQSSHVKITKTETFMRTNLIPIPDNSQSYHSTYDSVTKKVENISGGRKSPSYTPRNPTNSISRHRTDKKEEQTHIETGSLEQLPPRRPEVESEPRPSTGSSRTNISSVSTSTVKTYYGFYRNWRGVLRRCDCHELGSLGSSCHGSSGQCHCRPNVVGRDCGSCAPGHWGISSGGGCRPCSCGGLGSRGGECDAESGACQCAPGVGGVECDRCLPGYWGFSREGCKACEPCGVPGRSCHPSTGRCVCPPYTEGDRCERCVQGSFDYDLTNGCRKCQCAPQGSRSQQCSPSTGRCACRPGYVGLSCDACAPGHYGAPRCRPCDCDPRGTSPGACDALGRCQCNASGQCPCKEHATGPRCDRCPPATFGLSLLATRGCSSCYCFRRSTRCEQAQLTWSQVSLPLPRRITVEYGVDATTWQAAGWQGGGTWQGGGIGTWQWVAEGLPPPVATVIVRPWDSRQTCYVNLAMPGSRHLTTSPAHSPRLNLTSGLHVIPSPAPHVVLGSAAPFRAPLYWTLPRAFLRDKVHSYNGLLRFTAHSTGGSQPFPAAILSTYPLVSLKGNWQLVLEHYGGVEPGPQSVRLHEDAWRVKGTGQPVTREMMMVALQNLQHILLRATHAEDVQTAILSDVTLDVAVEGTLVSSRRALGVEQCVCPKGYEGTSCQNPSQGYFRWHKEDWVQSTIVIDLVGESRPCDCNGRSDTCDAETGRCLHCTQHTIGPKCELCASGYYGNPALAPCRPCACPSLENNRAETCEAKPSGGYVCHCRPGYTGDKCDRCAFGHYGAPLQPGGSCAPCDCDPHGALHEGCDANGRCSCKPNIRGRKCDVCAPRHVISSHGCMSCEDGCVDVLLDDVEQLTSEVASLNLTTAIPVPWGALRGLETEERRLRTQLTQHHSSEGSLVRLLADSEMEYAANDLLRRATTAKEDARSNVQPAVTTKDEADALMTLLDAINDELDAAMTLLTQYADGRGGAVSVGGAVVEARRLLAAIRGRGGRLPALGRNADVELVKALALLAKVRGLQIDRQQLTAVGLAVTAATTSVREMLAIVDAAKTRMDRAEIINRGVVARIGRVGEVLGEVGVTRGYVRDTQHNASALLREAAHNMRRTRANYKHLEAQLPRLHEQKEALAEHEAALVGANAEAKTDFVDPARQHALALTSQSLQLENLFTATRIGALGPLKAAQAYQRIVAALRDAEKAARNASSAANRAFREAYPGDTGQSLLRQAKNARLTSTALQKKGQSLMDKVSGLEEDLQTHAEHLSSASSTLSSTSTKLRHIQTDVSNNLGHSLRQDILNSLKKSRATQASLDVTTSAVDAIHTNLTRFLAFANDFSSVDAELLNGIRDKISAAEAHTTAGSGLASSLHTKADGLRTTALDLGARIRALRQKIQQTRQHAASIRVSVTPGPGGRCSRQYSPPLQPSTTTRLELSYAINTRHRDSLLLYVGTRNASEFVAVEMKHRRVQVTWDVGGGSTTLRHPARLLLNSPTVADDKRWYHIEFHRTGNQGRLAVRPANPEGMSALDGSWEPVTGASPAGHTRIDLGPETSGVWMGGAPPAALPHLSTTTLRGCLHYATVDGHQLGLWNFTSSTGCAACNEGVELIGQQEDEIAFGFTGSGYFQGRPSRYRSSKGHYSVVLAFRTLDENALLFLAVNPEKNQVFSLTLERGHLVFRVQFDDRTKIEVVSKTRLNNLLGMTTLSATVLNKAADGLRQAHVAIGQSSELATVRGGPDLELGSQPFYFGGVHPQFDRDTWGSSIELRSLMGCMSELSVLEDGKNPFTDGQFYGIENACSEKPISEVGFLGGSGYIELGSQELRRVANLGFTFRTMQPNALLMVSTFVGQPLPPGSYHPPDYYSVSLVEGHLDLRINTATTQHRLVSGQRFNDGQLHSLFVMKHNRKITLMVNDSPVNGTRLPRGEVVVRGPAEGGLYFGGVPVGVDVVEMVGSSVPFKGCISDVIVNDRVVSFARPVQFEAVFVGRCGDLPLAGVRGMQGDRETSLDSCRAPAQQTLEFGALKFGDRSESHAVLSLPRGTFADNFNISFEFRTYYPNGLFLYTQRHGHPDADVLTAKLLNGRVSVSLAGRRRGQRQMLTSQGAGLNSGYWRKVLISKHGRSLRVSIDGREAVKKTVPRRLLRAGTTYLGGLPRDVPQAQSMDPLRGCLRHLHLNGERLTVPQPDRPDLMVGVGQCFSSVQPGSFFPGDAYAIYSDELRVGAVMEFGLEFRTWQLDGLLLSVADMGAGTSLGLEIVDGDVVLNVTLGEGHGFGARVGFRNKHSMCDNAWHRVRAHFVKDSVTLRVDDHPEAYGFNGGAPGTPVWLEAPLYVGGLPDYAPQGSLSSREPFRGCLRNMVVDGGRTDWSDMFRLHNVLLNACPVH